MLSWTCSVLSLFVLQFLSCRGHEKPQYAPFFLAHSFLLINIHFSHFSVQDEKDSSLLRCWLILLESLLKFLFICYSYCKILKHLLNYSWQSGNTVVHEQLIFSTLLLLFFFRITQISSGQFIVLQLSFY